MGIRYYAYAFEAAETEHALANPQRFISRDPLADAWGLPHRSQVGVITGQHIDKADMLYLDKAWSDLQTLSNPNSVTRPRPAYRMFEGDLVQTDQGYRPWVRALSPDAVRKIAPDLVKLEQRVLRSQKSQDETDYVLNYLREAVVFVTNAATRNRGFAYMIG